jgi:transcriptional regulator with XRE-family HTH domain
MSARSDDKLTPGKLLKRWRVDNEKSQTDLAKILGTSQQVISNIESGDTTPKLDFVNLVRIKIGVDLTEANVLPQKAKKLLSKKEQDTFANARTTHDAGVGILIDLLDRVNYLEHMVAPDKRRRRADYRAFGSREAFKRAAGSN